MAARTVECELCDAGIRDEALASYLHKPAGRDRTMAMADFLSNPTGEYVVGTLKQGGVGALGDIASRTAFGYVSDYVPKASDPSVEAGSVAALAMITGGLVERFVPPLGGMGQAWAAVPVAKALLQFATRITGFNLSGGLSALDVYSAPGAVAHATVGELDHYANATQPATAQTIAGVI